MKKRAREKLGEEETEKEVQQTDKSGISELLATTAHDLWNIIGGIYGLTQIIEEELEKHPNPEIKKLTELITKQYELGIDVSTGLVKNFKQDICSLKELLTSQANLYQYKADRKNINFDTDFPDYDIYAETKPGLLVRVLDNLFDNAVKFTPREGQITLGLERRGLKAIIFIKDTGIGIPADLHHQLFKKFKQIQRAGTENEPSSGLGLSISTQLTKELKGKLWVKSTENKGTTFYLSLPSCKPPPKK